MKNSDFITEACIVVFDGTSYFIAETDYEFGEGEELSREFNSLEEADEYCEKENALNLTL